MMDELKECMKNNESRVFKNAFPNLFSAEEFNKLLNLRSFQTTQRLIPTKEVRKLTNGKVYQNKIEESLG